MSAQRMQAMMAKACFGKDAHLSFNHDLAAFLS